MVGGKAMPFYTKNIEEHIKHQNTKDILEDIREKLAVLLKPMIDSDAESSTESDSGAIAATKCNLKAILLKRNITALKHDVDNYLVLMNQQNEMEIRAFCSSLSKNYKLLAMQHALGNRMRQSQISTTSDIGSEIYSNRSFTGSSSSSHIISYIDYHQSVIKRRRRLKTQLKNNHKLKNQLRANSKSKSSLNRCTENDSARCSSSSDSNFQLQRRHSDSICSMVS